MDLSEIDQILIDNFFSFQIIGFFLYKNLTQDFLDKVLVKPDLPSWVKLYTTYYCSKVENRQNSCKYSTSTNINFLEQKTVLVHNGGLFFDYFLLKLGKKNKISPVSDQKKIKSDDTPQPSSQEYRRIGWQGHIESVHSVQTVESVHSVQSVFDQINKLAREESANINWVNERQKQKNDKIYNKTRKVLRSKKAQELISQLPEDVRIHIFTQWLKLYNKESIVASISQFYCEKKQNKTEYEWKQAVLLDDVYEGINQYIAKQFNEEIMSLIVNGKQEILKPPESSERYHPLILYLSKVLFHLQSHILEPEDDDYYNDVTLFQIKFEVSEYNFEKIIGIKNGTITIKISTSYAEVNEEKIEKFNVNIVFESPTKKDTYTFTIDERGSVEDIIYDIYTKDEITKFLGIDKNVELTGGLYIPHTSTYTRFSETPYYFLEKPPITKGGSRIFAIHKKYVCKNKK